MQPPFSFDTDPETGRRRTDLDGIRPPVPSSPEGALFAGGLMLLTVVIYGAFWLIGLGFRSAVSVAGPVIVAHRLETVVYIGFAFALLTLAVLLYRQRCRHRALYGFGELVVGTLSILESSKGLLTALTTGMDPAEHFDIRTTVLLAGGLYIVIRGLANIEEAFAIGPEAAAKGRFRRFWVWAFYKPLRDKSSSAAITSR